MANIQERRDKTGKLISYSIRVHRGRGPDGRQLKPWTATFDVAPTWTEKSARKKAEAFAATFEKECREGVTSDSRRTFQNYSDYVLETKEARGGQALRHRPLQGADHQDLPRYWPYQTEGPAGRPPQRALYRFGEGWNGEGQYQRHRKG